jgi:hypothetical protein
MRERKMEMGTRRKNVSAAERAIEMNVGGRG